MSFPDKNRYHWAKYADGKWHTFKQGKHFQVSVLSFKSAFYNWARRNAQEYETYLEDKKTISIRATR